MLALFKVLLIIYKVRHMIMLTLSILTTIGFLVFCLLMGGPKGIGLGIGLTVCLWLPIVMIVLVSYLR